MSQRWSKDPNSRLLFRFDFAPLVNGRGDSNWLDQSSSPVEVISTQTTVIEDADESPVQLTIHNSSITESGTSVTVDISGGTSGVVYMIRCRIVTSNSQTEDAVAFLRVSGAS